jgi:hypothetical protein
LDLTDGQAGSKLLVRLYADATDCCVLLPEEEDSVHAALPSSPASPPDCTA